LEAREASGSETARVHHAARRRGGVADRGAGAAERKDSPRRLHGQLDGEALETNLIGSFREGLREHGYVEGRNIEIVFRWAKANTNSFPFSSPS
jgi:hypothetical protein